MKREFHTQFSFALKDSVTQGFTIAWLVKQSDHLPARWQEIAQVKDDWARLEILSQVIITNRKEEARMGTRKMSGGLRYWIESHSQDFFKQQINYMKSLNLLPPLPDLSIFPYGSWVARITFTLKKPYISRDDKEFYILDNPVKKEWVFKVPYVAPTQWKGTLRAAMRRLRGYTTWEEEADDEQMMRLFGNVKGEEQDFSSGYLHFYPTFFDKIGIEVINPHDRRTGAGRNPIYFECVPAGTVGAFTILYVPMGVRPVDENDAKEDIKAVARGIRTMLTEYGFGAKTSSGYGVGEVKEGDIVVVPEERRDEFIGGWRDSDDESV